MNSLDRETLMRAVEICQAQFEGGSDLRLKFNQGIQCCIDRLIAHVPVAPPIAPTAPEVLTSALQQFNEIGCDGSPLERLRFFCSLAMTGQDWLDVEPFFDAVSTAPEVDALMDAAANLAAAASAYRQHACRHKSIGRAVADPFYTTRIKDFDAAVERATAAVRLDRAARVATEP